jgi:hypothetical protein
VYRDAQHEVPQRYIEDKPKQAGKNPKTAQKPTAHKPRSTRSTLSGSRPATVTRARTRLARGTGAPTDARPTTQTTPATAPAFPPRTAGVRPGFRT